MSQWHDYFKELAHKILGYITDETVASLYYQQLAILAPSREDREILAQLATDEARHAANFREVYRQITGQEARRSPTSPPKNLSYQQAIRQRILAESNDFMKYGDDFLTAPDMYLRSLFYKTGASEAQHGMSLSLLLNTPQDYLRQSLK